MKEVVEVLNKYIEKNYHLKGKFIPSKSFVIDKNFKSFRTYYLNMYYVIGKKSIPIIEEAFVVKDNSEKTESIIREKFLEAVFDYIDSNEFKDLVDGRIVF